MLISGDKITDVGSSNTVRIPAGAKVIDLSQATVLPGLIDGHVHLTDAAGNYQHQMMVGLNSATRSLNAGFTTLVAMGSHGGGYADVELKRAIESDLVKGPRLLTAGPIIDVTGPGTAVLPDEFRAPGPGHGRQRGGGNSQCGPRTRPLRRRPYQGDYHWPVLLQVERRNGEHGAPQPRKN